jgi:hypothetical protein
MSIQAISVVSFSKNYSPASRGRSITMHDISLSPEVLALVAGILVLLAGFAVQQFRKLNRAKLLDEIRANVPADFQTIAVWCGARAFDAVEQLCDAYEAMTNEQKQAKATEYFLALFKLLTKGKVTDAAAVAVLESMIYTSKQGQPPKPAPVEAAQP